MTDASAARPWQQVGTMIWSPTGAANVCQVSAPRPESYFLEHHEPEFGCKEAYANAALIVRAVNAHDDLVAALRIARAPLAAERENLIWGYSHAGSNRREDVSCEGEEELAPIEEALAAIDSALAKAVT